MNPYLGILTNNGAATETQEGIISSFNKKCHLRLSWSTRNELEKFKTVFSFQTCSVSQSLLRVVYLCIKLPEGVRGMLNLYEPDSLT